MADGGDIPGDIPAIDLSDPEVARDPFTAYGRARQRAPLARLIAPGLGPMWAVTRYADARAMLADRRFRLSPVSFLRPQVREDCLPYLRTMQEMEGAEHARLRRLVAVAFTPRQADRLRPRIEGLVQALLDDLPGRASWTSAGPPGRGGTSATPTGRTSASVPRWPGPRSTWRWPRCCAATPGWNWPTQVARSGGCRTRPPGGWPRCRSAWVSRAGPAADPWR